MKKLAMFIPVLLVVGCTANGTTGSSPSAAFANRDTSWQQARLVGEETDCIQTLQIAQTYIRSPEIIDFRLRDGRMFRNELRQSCPLLDRPTRAIGYDGARNQLCAINVVTVLPPAPGGLSGTCGLGQFQPIDPLPA